MNQSEILTFLKSHKREIEEKFHVTSLGLFGSYATETNRTDSDIDILVSMPSDFDLYYDLKEYLEHNLHSKVDLGTHTAMRAFISDSIKESILYV